MITDSLLSWATSVMPSRPPDFVIGEWALPSKHSGSTGVQATPCDMAKGSRLLLHAVRRSGSHPAPLPPRKHPQQAAIAAAHPARWSRA